MRDEILLESLEYYKKHLEKKVSKTIRAQDNINSDICKLIDLEIKTESKLSDIQYNIDLIKFRNS